MRVLSLAATSSLSEEAALHIEGLELVNGGWDFMQGHMYPTLPSAPPFPLPVILLTPTSTEVMIESSFFVGLSNKIAFQSLVSQTGYSLT